MVAGIPAPLLGIGTFIEVWILGARMAKALLESSSAKNW